MSRRTPRPHGPISLREWAQEPGKVVTRGEVLALLVHEERRREALAAQRWWRRLAAWARKETIAPTLQPPSPR